MTASVREPTPSLLKMCVRCACTVRRLTNRRLAMRALLKPQAASRRISRSRSVRSVAFSAGRLLMLRLGREPCQHLLGDGGVENGLAGVDRPHRPHHLC